MAKLYHHIAIARTYSGLSLQAWPAIFMLILNTQSLFPQCSGTLITPSSDMILSTNSYATSGTFTGDLTVNGGVTLCLQGTAAINLGGDLTNNGTINHTSSGVFTVVDNVYNSGTITTTSADFSQTNGMKVVENNSDAVMSIAGDISMAGDVTNDGGTITSTGGSFTKTTTSKFYKNLNGGLLAIYGNITLEGNITNCGSIQITNSGAFINIGTASPITNNAGSTIYIQGTGLTSTIESQIYNYGRIIIEGNWSHSNDADDFYNYAGGYIRVCGQLLYTGNIYNYGELEVMGQLRHTNNADQVINYSGGVMNVTDDIDLINCLTIV